MSPRELAPQSVDRAPVEDARRPDLSREGSQSECSLDLLVFGDPRVVAGHVLQRFSVPSENGLAHGR